MNHGGGDRACRGLAARTVIENYYVTRILLFDESKSGLGSRRNQKQTTTYECGEQWWDLAGSGAPSLTAQLPLLDGAEGKSDGTVNKDKIRALAPNSPGKDVRDSLGFHEETPDAPQWHPLESVGGWQPVACPYW